MNSKYISSIKADGLRVFSQESSKLKFINLDPHIDFIVGDEIAVDKAYDVVTYVLSKGGYTGLTFSEIEVVIDDADGEDSPIIMTFKDGDEFLGDCIAQKRKAFSVDDVDAYSDYGRFYFELDKQEHPNAEYINLPNENARPIIMQMVERIFYKYNPCTDMYYGDDGAGLFAELKMCNTAKTTIYNMLVCILNWYCDHTDGAIDTSKLTGVVALKYPESRLHIKYHRSLMATLSSYFPGIQFIVFTNSPYLIAGASECTVHRIGRNLNVDLDNISCKDPVGTIGWRVFHAEDLDRGVRNKLSALKYSLIDKFDEEDSLAMLNFLKEQAEALKDVFGEDSFTYAGIKCLLERKEKQITENK